MSKYGTKCKMTVKTSSDRSEYPMFYLENGIWQVIVNKSCVFSCFFWNFWFWRDIGLLLSDVAADTIDETWPQMVRENTSETRAIQVWRAIRLICLIVIKSDYLRHMLMPSVNRAIYTNVKCAQIHYNITQLAKMYFRHILKSNHLSVSLY